MTGFLYDAEGRRVQKVQVEGWNTPHPQTVMEDEYLLGLNGEQVTVLNGTGAWQWTNVYAGGRQLATYDSAGTHFALTDWLGTKRVELNVTGVSTVAVGEQRQSLPYGDGLSCMGTDVNQLHFTGKQPKLVLMQQKRQEKGFSTATESRLEAQKTRDLTTIFRTPSMNKLSGMGTKLSAETVTRNTTFAEQ